MEDRIREIFRESSRVKEVFLQNNLKVFQDAITDLVEVLRSDHKILLFGNGGSAADAQHITAEFVNRFAFDRRPLPAIALTTDTSVLTSIANDFSFDEVFSKQIIALGQPGDAAIGISTSGASPNVVQGLEASSKKGIVTIGLGGPADSPMREYCKHYLWVDGEQTARIQEVHELVGHTAVDIIERMLFDSGD